MKNHLTEIAFILDRSGSMNSMIEPAISGFNRLIREQQAAPGDARFSLILFNDLYEVPIRSIPIAEVVELDTTTYVPRSSTALLDAIGRTINELVARMAVCAADDRPDQVIVAILTDGHENSSREFTWLQISDRISKLTAEGWQFLFLGADQDAIATAGRLNIEAKNSANFAMHSKSFGAAKDALSRKMTAVRRRSQGDQDSATLHDAEAPLDSLREEEEMRDSK